MAFCDAIRQFPSFLRLLLLLLLALASAAEIRNKTIRIRSLVLPFPPIARSVTAISPRIYCNDPSNGKTRGRRLGAEHERSFVHSSSYISLALFLYYIRMSFRGSLTQSKSHWHLLAFSSFRFVAAAEFINIAPNNAHAASFPSYHPLPGVWLCLYTRANVNL